jgi:hypothetical protein
LACWTGRALRRSPLGTPDEAKLDVPVLVTTLDQRQRMHVGMNLLFARVRRKGTTSCQEAPLANLCFVSASNRHLSA